MPISGNRGRSGSNDPFSGRLGQGDAREILVVSVIDPGLAPLFGLAGGLIAEMGGTLSHGAIIAREYGLPTIANVEGAMARLSDEMQVTIDAGSGTIRIEPFPQLAID